MKIHGIDFTSVPGPKKAITLAACKIAMCSKAGSWIRNYRWFIDTKQVRL